MVPRPMLRSFVALWMLTGLVLLIAGAVTVREAWPGSPHANSHLVLLGGVEAVAALFFVILPLGQFRGDLVVYGVAILFVMGARTAYGQSVARRAITTCRMTTRPTDERGWLRSTPTGLANEASHIT